jgi:hypothetical protein
MAIRDIVSIPSRPFAPTSAPLAALFLAGAVCRVVGLGSIEK